ncbi:MAG: HYR domain-containing protein [Lewinellaceae bacterium]|nr:HYR domain-containing protein [Lewinellaceae bacterium]
MLRLQCHPSCLHRRRPRQLHHPGTSVTFTATPTNGGSTPAYQWKVNGMNVGTNQATYTSTTLVDGDVVTCEMTSSALCVDPTTATSNGITMTVTAAAPIAACLWTSQTSAADNSWTSVTYGNGVFVAVANSGTGNRVMTSPDGIIWTSQTSAANNDWTSVTYGNGLFVAVANSGTGNRVMTSPDGINWTIRTSAANNAWLSVTYGDGLFVAVAISGTGNRVMTSPDGINWTIQTSAANNEWWSVTYGNGLFVAVANFSNLVMTSPDGIAWTLRTAAANNAWTSVTYGDGLFVAVARSGSGNQVMTSPDGINWTSRTTPAATNFWLSVTYGNGLFVAVAPLGFGNLVMTSPDGINWTSRTPASNNTWQSVTYGNGIFVAVAGSGTGNRVMTGSGSLVPASVSIAADPSGAITPGTSVTFTATPTNGGSTPAYQWKVNGMNVGTDQDTYTSTTLQDGDVVTCEMTSSDPCADPTTATSNGITMEVSAPAVACAWTSQTSAADNEWYSVTYGNGLFVAVAQTGSGNRVMTSPDGITWTIRTSAANNDWRSVTYGNGLFVAVAQTGTGNRVMTSPDGITWTIRTSAADNEWLSVTYGNGLFVAVAQTGSGDRVMTSPDGIAWTSRTSAGDNVWTSVTYGNGLFVAVAFAGVVNRVMTSPDGINWTLRTAAADNGWLAVTYGNGLFVAVATSGTGNRVMTSPDGITWTSQSYPVDNNWRALTYGNGLFVALSSTGTGNRVMTSPNGITWTIQTSAADNAWRSVTYGNGLFVAVASSGTGNRVMTGSGLTPSVAIAADPSGAITAGTSVTFTATPTNGGSTPAYQWKVNGTNVGTDQATYTSTTLVDGDLVTCEMTSNDPCADPATATSMGITMEVSSPCTFTPANVIVTGFDNGYEIHNGTYTPSGSMNGAPVWSFGNATIEYNGSSWRMKASGSLIAINFDGAVDELPCTGWLAEGSAPPVLSGGCGSLSGTLTPTVAIAADPSGAITPGTSVTFTATPTNGGSTPAYQWKVNGMNVGTDQATYTSTTLANNDVVTCEMTSNEPCADPTTATSNEVTMTVATPCPPVFMEATANPFEQVRESSIAFADVDGDNDLDLLITGNNTVGENKPGNGSNSTPGPVAILYTNDGNGVFTEVTGTPFVGVDRGDVAFADVNGDTYKDVLITGVNASFAKTAKLFTNNGSGVFTEVTGTPFEGVDGSSIAFADVDGDLDQDALITGFNASNQSVSKLYTNNGSGVFTEVTGTPFDAVQLGSIAFADVDGDSDQDVMVTGENNSGLPFSQLYLNGNEAAVAIAADPGNSIVEGTSVTFTATPTNGGSTPAYQWKVNGTNVGTDQATYTSTTLEDGDVVTCELTSSDPCTDPAMAVSNEIAMEVETVLTPECTKIHITTNCSGFDGDYLFTDYYEGAGYWTHVTEGYEIYFDGDEWVLDDAFFNNSTDSPFPPTTGWLPTPGGDCDGQPITNFEIIQLNGPPEVTISVDPSDAIEQGTNATFTATPLYGGDTPIYQWKLNGNPVGTDSDTYANATLANGDVVTCELTSNDPCLSTTMATSNAITMEVVVCNGPLTAAVAIDANPSGSLAAGTSVTFTAAPTNGGTSPVYQWRVNGNPVGTNSNTYTTDALEDGNVVTCDMNTHNPCAAPPTVTSNAITMVVGAFPAPSFTGLDNTYCDLDAPVTLMGNLPGALGSFEGPGVTDNGDGTATFIPANAIGSETIRYISTANHIPGWVSVSAGSYHTIGLKADGTLWAWGDNGDYGQYGIGNFTSSEIPVQVGTDNDWANITTGGNFTIALKTNGTLWAWGSNSYGELGIGNFTASNVPVQIGTDTDWASISTRSFHTVALKSDGTLWAWGYNTSGQLGIGTNTNSNVPVQVGTENNWSSIGAGGNFSLASKTDGTLWSWGENSGGQLGNGNSTNTNTPGQIGSATDWNHFVAGDSEAFAFKTNGTLWAWGYNTYGQLGIGNNTNQNTPTQVGTDTDWSSLDANFSCYAIKSDGTLWSWGYNGYGVLVNGTETDTNTPGQIGTGNDWAYVTIGNSNAFAITGNGSLYAAGRNDYYQLGDGTDINRNTFTKVISAVFTADVNVEICVDFAGLDPTYCGDDSPVTLTGNRAPEGTFSGPGITDNGNGTATFDPAGAGAGGTVTYAFGSAIWADMSAGNYHSLGIKTDGTLWGWGYNDDGQLGNGTYDATNVPVQSGTSNDWANVSAGFSHSLGVKTDGTLWGWGENDSGELGSAGNYNPDPLQLFPGTDWVQVEAGYYVSFALKSDGTLWAWGYNGYGLLGNGTTTDSNTPVQVGTASDWASISTNPRGEYALATKTDGTLWAWGTDNTNGQFGTGNTSTSLVPIQSGTATDWVKVDAGINHSVGVKTAGTAWGWGDNFYGQLGDGTTTNSSVPVQAGPGTDWADITTANDCTNAVKTDGTLWGWGYNHDGQLGNGNNDNTAVPVQSGSDTDWAKVKGSEYNGYFSLGLKTDGNLYGWGINQYGQIGNGTQDETNVPSLTGPLLTLIEENQSVTVTPGVTGITSFGFTSCNGNMTYVNEDDYTTGNITVNFTSIPASGTLDLSGSGLLSIASVDVSNLSSNSYTFNDVHLLCTGANVEITASFSISTCDASAMIATPLPCSRYVFTGTGNWDVPANWQDNNQPATSGNNRHFTYLGDAVIYPGMSFDSYGDSVVVAMGGSLDMQKAVTFSKSDGSVNGTGGFENNGTVTLTGNGTATFPNMDLFNNGDFTINGGSNGLSMSGAANLFNTGTITNLKKLESYSNITNYATGVIDNQAEIYFSSGVFTNEGEFTHNWPGNSLYWYMGVNNSGTFNVEAGTIEFSQYQNAYFTNTGTVTNSGTSIFNGSPTVTNEATGTFTNLSTMTLRKGMAQNGAFLNDVGGTLNIEYGNVGLVNNGTLTNEGTIEQKDAAFFRNNNLMYQNATMNCSAYSFFENNDSLVVSTGATINITISGLEFTNAATGTFILDGTMTASNPTASVFVNRGILKGTGTLDNSAGRTLDNDASGHIQPGANPGTLTINKLANTAGAIDIEIGGTTPGTGYDVLNLPTSSTLGGTLNVTLINGFVPACGDAFDIITHASNTGTFSTVNLPAGFSIEYLADKVTLTYGQLNISLANISAAECNNTTCTTDDTYTADVTVTFSSKPASGTLSLTGPNILVPVMAVDVSTIGATSHTFTGVEMLANGGDIDLTAAFSEGCSFNDDAVGTAPACGGTPYTPSNITVSGFGCFGPEGTYSPNGTVNGAPAWLSGFGFTIEWSGSQWEIEGQSIIWSANTTGSITNLPCSTGWTDPTLCALGPGTIALSGGCGNLTGSGGPACAVSNISLANLGSCNDNSTTTETDDYFTADVTVTFAYAPAGGTLTLKRGSTVVATMNTDLTCTTTHTFTGVHMTADGSSIVLTAEFTSGCTFTSSSLGTAPAPCSCVPATFMACPAAQMVSTTSTTCNTAVNFTATAGGSPAPVMTYAFSGVTMGSGSGTGSGETFNLGVTNVTVTATNDCGNPTCSFTVTVSDNTQPSVVCKPHTVALDASGMASISTADVFQSGSDNCGTVNQQGVAPSSFTCANLGANTVTLTVNDGNGNTNTCTATVTVQDNTQPTVVCKNHTVALDANGMASITTADVFQSGSDNCGTVNQQGVAPSSFTCANLGANTVTLTVNDGNGNTNTCTATVTVQDNTQPSVVCKPHTVALDANGMASISTADVFQSGSDNCGTVNQQGVAPSSFACANLGANTVTLTVNDGNGNTNTCTATVTVQDNTQPNVVCKNHTVALDANNTASITTANVFQSGSDNCGTVNQVSVLPNSFNCANIGANTVTLTVNDGNGNTNTCNATVTVQDNTPPTAICQNLTVQLNNSGGASVSKTQINNGSFDNCGTVNLVSATPSAFNCNNIGPNSVTLAINDGNGNTATCTATVTVQDNLPPTVTCKNATLNLGANGTVVLSPAQVFLSGTDNCGTVNPALVAPSLFNCAHVGTNTVNLIVNDGHGNTANCNATVTIVDNAAPAAICKNATAYLNASGSATITAGQINNGSADNCGIASLGASPTSFTCANIGGNQVTLTVTDANGNSSSCYGTVTVADNLPPTVACKNISVALDANGAYALSPAQVFEAAGSSDNCGTVSPASVSPSTLYCSNVGANTVTLTANDGHGNTATCQATVTVQPFVTINSITASPENCGQGNGSIVVSATAGGGQLGYSIDGGNNYQFGNTFENLTAGFFSVRVLVYGAPGCTSAAFPTTVGAIGSTQTWYRDKDADGYSSGQAFAGCNGWPGPGWYLPNQLAATSGDCDDDNPNIHPGALEICDGLDNDCNGSPEAATNTWTGNGDGTQWADPANWSDGTVPLPCQDVVIPPGNNVNVATGVEARGRTLDVQLGSVLTTALDAVLDIINP